MLTTSAARESRPWVAQCQAVGMMGLVNGRRAHQDLAPEVLRWARRRAGLSPDTLAAKMKVRRDRLREWEKSGRISLAQADRLALLTRTPLGYLFLKAPPKEELPIADFRTRLGEVPADPSPDLWDTLHLMRQRQAWMHDDLVESGAEPLAFVGASAGESSPEVVAGAMRRELSLSPGWAVTQPGWTSALRHLRDCAEQARVLTVFNGIVGNNTSRRLDSSEFQGFALVDRFAPLVFVNAADFQAAQMFTLALELVQVFVGAPGLSKLGAHSHPHDETERFCNAVAVEFLVPADQMASHWPPATRVGVALRSVARRFKVSTVVAARRAVSLNLMSPSQFRSFYERLSGTLGSSPGGGNGWNTQHSRIGRRFGSAVCRAVVAGRLTYREAWGLTGLRGRAFDHFLRRTEASS